MKTIFKKLLFILLLLPAVILAQSTVSGTVTEQTSALPLPTVNIIIKNTTQGTATDFDGNYTLEVKNGDVLAFSYVGYLTQEITYTGQSRIDVSLIEDASQLDEIVIIGYGSVKKEDLTGSVDVVSSKDFNRGAIVSTDQLLQGKAAGVRITDSGGSPDSAPNIRIRGGASLNADSSPLIVIDGVPIGGQNPAGVSNPLSLVNPNDVESFTILKDASATVEGELDPRGVKGEDVNPRIQVFHVKLTLTGVSQEEANKLTDAIKKRCPVYTTLERSAPIELEVELKKE